MGRAQLLERLESRQYFAIGADGFDWVTTQPTPTSPMIRVASSQKGAFAVEASAEDDAIFVKRRPDGRVLIAVVSRLSHIDRISTGNFDFGWDGMTNSLSVAEGTFHGAMTFATSINAVASGQIYINGMGGNDRLYVDLGTHMVTKQTNVELRVLTGPTGKQITSIDTTDIPGVYSGQTRNWLKRSLAQIRLTRDPSAETVFIGDSMTQYFVETGKTFWDAAFGRFKPLNIGLVGDSTSQLLYRIRNQGLFDGLAPKTVVLNIGTNNVALTDDSEAVAAGVKAVLDEIRRRLPESKVLLTSILPRRTNAENRVVNKVNDRLSFFADGDEIRFLNTTANFSGPRAVARYYRSGSLHLSAAGYREWARLIEPALAEISPARELVDTIHTSPADATPHPVI